MKTKWKSCLKPGRQAALGILFSRRLVIGKLDNRTTRAGGRGAEATIAVAVSGIGGGAGVDGGAGLGGGGARGNGAARAGRGCPRCRRGAERTVARLVVRSTAAETQPRCQALVALFRGEGLDPSAGDVGRGARLACGRDGGTAVGRADVGQSSIPTEPVVQALQPDLVLGGRFVGRLRFVTESLEQFPRQATFQGIAVGLALVSEDGDQAGGVGQVAGEGPVALP